MTTTSPHAPTAAEEARGPRVGRVLLALSALLGPLMLALAVGTLPYATDDSTKELVAAIADDRGMVQLSQWGWALGLILLVPGTVGVGLLAMTRSPKLGLWGAAVFGTGLLAIATTPNLDQVTLGGLEKGVGQQALVRVTDGTYELAVNAVPTLYFVAAHVIGAILLGVALLRGRSVPAWAAWVLILSMPLNVVGFVAGLMPVAVLSFVMLAVGFGAAGLVIARDGTGWVRAS
ncbi:hypothetical protein [Streptomyces sp. RG80]|uniref:hypothetical protein n=1 Tax=Streptomyces sp. RG80 TaxID=3157340 RepID=UPI0033903661